MNRAKTYADECRADDERKQAIIRTEAKMNTDRGDLFWTSYRWGPIGQKRTHRTLWRNEGAGVSACWATHWQPDGTIPTGFGPEMPKAWADWTPAPDSKLILIDGDEIGRIVMLANHAPTRVDEHLRQLCEGDNR